jgi:hypothetical protein
MTKMNRDNIIGFLTKLNELPKDLKYNKHLLFSISKTKTTLSELIKEVGEKEKALYTEDYRKINSDRRAIVESLALRNEDGTFASNGNELVFTEDNKAILQESIDKFNEDHKEVIAAINAASKDLQDYIFEEVEFDITTTVIDSLPDQLDIETYNLLSMFIKE